MVVHVVLDTDTGVTILTGGDQEQIQVITGDYSKDVLHTATGQVHHLPPLTLRFRLPPCYPSSQPPAYTLSCPWLAPGHLASLQLQLDSIYTDTGGGVVLFSWLSFLQVKFFSSRKRGKS